MEGEQGDNQLHVLMKNIPVKEGIKCKGPYSCIENCFKEWDYLAKECKYIALIKSSGCCF